MTSPVIIRAYDLSRGKAETWSPVLLGQTIRGIWHTGVLVFGKEYFYGGSIFKVPPSDMESLIQMKPLDTIVIGSTHTTQAEFERFILSVGRSFTREAYDLTNWNCNHFSDAACRFLLDGIGLPNYILDLPEDIAATFAGRVALSLVKNIRQCRHGSAPAVDGDVHREVVEFELRRRSIRAEPEIRCASFADVFQEDEDSEIVDLTSRVWQEAKHNVEEALTARQKSKPQRRRWRGPLSTFHESTV
ncbi:MAG: hypothetical protein KVP17_001099 [Porospora cf. gigantea B]|uniref:uncharacterized protein n=1 Tax=Porospora cf. gigantea B TaxID=2853592 RepID=UPI003571B658|nr:MAG: hypothetical protein KVP17_001099 [Porospora cf. gigantea B]